MGDFMARRIVFEMAPETTDEDFRAVLKNLATDPRVRNIRQALSEDLSMSKAIILSDDGTIIGHQG
jgi:hypothetical protein